MANQFYTRDEITYETLVILKNKLILGKCCLRQFDDQFGNEGAKIGDTLRVRLPPRYVSTSGTGPAAQGVNESYRIIQANNQTNIYVTFNSKDLAVSFDNALENLVTPVAEQIASDVDQNGMAAATSGYSVTNSGYFSANYAASYAGFSMLATPGGYPGALGCTPWVGNTLNQAAATQQQAAQVFVQARARITEEAAPAGDQFAILSPSAMGATVQNMFVNFNPSSEVSELYRTGLMGTFAGARFYESNNPQIFTSGTWTNNANVGATSSNGDSTLTVWRVGNAASIVQGDQFVVAGVYGVNPINRQSQGVLRVFTVTAAANANTNGTSLGAVTVNVFPPIYNAGQPQTVSALPTAGSNVYFQGTSNTATTTNLFFQKNAIALAVAPLSDDLPGAEVSVVRDNDISLRYVKQYAIGTDLRGERFDILYGWATVRPELGCILRA